MVVLLDEDEKVEQQAFLFGPPPLGPGAPPLDRLLAYGRERLRFVHGHYALLSDANRDPQTRFNAPTAQLVLLDPDYVHHRLNERGATLKSLGDAWESLARRLCGT